MPIEITDYTNVGQKIHDLGCDYPDGFAFLPANFESATAIEEFKQVSEAATVKTLFRNAGLPTSDIVESSRRPSYIHNNSVEWIAPIIFVSGAFLTENPTYMSLALNVISTYLTDIFRGKVGQPIAKLEVVVKTTDEEIYRKFSYEGPVDGIEPLAPEIHKIVNE